MLTRYKRMPVTPTWYEGLITDIAILGLIRVDCRFRILCWFDILFTQFCTFVAFPLASPTGLGCNIMKMFYGRVMPFWMI